MQIRDILLHIFRITFLIGLSLGTPGWSLEGGVQETFRKESRLLTEKSFQEVASLGAPTTGPLLEGNVGAIRKGYRHQFYCHSPGPTIGFLGPQSIVKPVSVKDQPGVFPAPLMGAASITFRFHCQDSQAWIIPLVVRPDGTVFRGFPMNALHSPQTLVISSPAQTGIYTLFALSHGQSFPSTYVTVETSISTQPHYSKTLSLKTFGPNEKDVEKISAEWIYIPSF